MATPNLALPTIDNTMTADVPRDVNALANAVDTQVAAQLALKAPLATPTFTGAVITLAADPASALQAATRQYVDGRSIPYAAATGTANTYAVTISPAPTAYTDGMAVSVKINVDASAASTLNVNALGAKPLKKANGTAVTNMKANGVYTFRYNATTGNFILQGEGGSGNAQPVDVLINKTFTNDNGEQIGTLVTNPTGGSQIYNSSGSFNFTVPAGVTRIWTALWGGGGGGGGGLSSGTSLAGTGAGGGGFAFGIFNVTPGQVIALTVGAGGVGGAIDSNGSTGGNTSFSSLTALGGGAGKIGGSGAGTGSGFSGSSNVYNFPGGNGGGQNGAIGGGGGGGAGSSGAGGNGTSSAFGAGGSGANSTLGAAGNGGQGMSGAAGQAGSSPGGGGGGGGGISGSTTYVGGNGAVGQVVVYW